MFKVKYTFKKQVLTKAFYSQKEFHVFIGMIRKNPEVSNIEILSLDLSSNYRKVA